MTDAFHPDAEAEYLEAIAYDETRKPGLGAVFMAEVEHFLGRVCDAPHRVRSPGSRTSAPSTPAA